jgi:hypothetical protein
VSVCVFLNAGQAQGKKDQKSEPEKKARVPKLKATRELGVPSFTSKVTVYYSKGHEKHAKELSGLLEDGMRFYEDKLKIKAELSVAVLSKADWERAVEGIPYGFPFVSAAPHVVMLPATCQY